MNYDPAKLAIAQFDCHTGAATWVDNAKRYHTEIPLCFAPDSDEATDAWWWISDMEDSPYTAGFIWERIPFTAESLSAFAARNAQYRR